MADSLKFSAEQSATDEDTATGNNTYTVSEQQLDQVTCYKVQEKITAANQARALAIILNNPMLKNLPDDVRSGLEKAPICALRVLNISKDKFALVSYEQYDQNGRKMAATYNKNITFDTLLTDDLFQIPTNMVQQTADSPMDMMNNKN